MIYKAITLCAIIAVIQPKSTGTFASFSGSPKHEVRKYFEDLEAEPSTRFSQYSPPNGNEVQQQGVEYPETKLVKSQNLRPNVEDYNEYDDKHYNAHPKYKYTYSVNDDHTGDYKSHFEERDGDAVHGEYVIADPDGSIRTVTYTADSKNGFQAVVKTTKSNSPSYQTEASLANQIQSDYKPDVRPTAPIDVQNDYNRPTISTGGQYYITRESEDGYRPTIPTSGQNGYTHNIPYVRPTNPTEHFIRPSIPKEVEDGYRNYIPTEGQNNYQHHIRPSIPKEVEDGYKPYVRPTIPTGWQHNYQQHIRPSIPKEVEDGPYVRPTIPTGGQDNYQHYIRTSNSKQVEDDYKIYVRPTIPAEVQNDYNHYVRPSIPKEVENNFRPTIPKNYRPSIPPNDYKPTVPPQVQNDYKPYVRPTIPPQLQNDYKSYVRPTMPYVKPTIPPRHPNVVSELRHKERLNRRTLMPEFISDEDDNFQEKKFNPNSYRFEKSEELGGGFTSKYGFRQKSKDQDGLGSESVESYVHPDSDLGHRMKFYER